MNEHQGRAGRRREIRYPACVALLFALCAAPSGAMPLISEFFYDAVGSDDAQSFVELYAAPGTDLTGVRLEGVNGANGSIGPVVELAGVVPSDGLYVVADLDAVGGTDVAIWHQLANFDFQNGPDSVVLRDGDAVLDALAYGDFTGGEVFAGEGQPAPDAPAGSSLARHFADLDHDDNAFDFAIADPSPGTAPRSVPEPSASLLFATGLLSLAVVGRARRGDAPPLA